MFARCFRLMLTITIAFVLVLSLLPGQAASARQTRSSLASIVPAVMNWQQVNANGFGDPTYQTAHSLAVFNNQLYAGAGHWDGAGASIWRTSDGSNWSPVMTGGFGTPNIVSTVVGMTAFKGNLYAGTGWGKRCRASSGVPRMGQPGTRSREMDWV